MNLYAITYIPMNYRWVVIAGLTDYFFFKRDKLASPLNSYVVWPDGSHKCMEMGFAGKYPSLEALVYSYTEIKYNYFLTS